MNRSDILKTANVAVNKDRQATHGKPERNFESIARLWTAYLEKEITPVDVGMMMILLKVARQKSNPAYEDNYVDMAGYSACAGEIATTAHCVGEVPYAETIRD